MKTMKAAILTITALAAATMPCMASSAIAPGAINLPTNMTQTEKRQSIDVLVQHIRQNPSDLQTRRRLVELLISAGYSNKAAVEMQGLVKAGLRSPEDFCLLGDAYRYAGKQTSAILNYQESLNINPLYARAKTGLAFCYMILGAPKIAEKLCIEAMLKSQERGARVELANALKTIKDSEKPVAVAVKAI